MCLYTMCVQQAHIFTTHAQHMSNWTYHRGSVRRDNLNHARGRGACEALVSDFASRHQVCVYFEAIIVRLYGHDVEEKRSRNMVQIRLVWLQKKVHGSKNSILVSAFTSQKKLNVIFDLAQTGSSFCTMMSEETVRKHKCHQQCHPFMSNMGLTRLEVEESDNTAKSMLTCSRILRRRGKLWCGTCCTLLVHVAGVINVLPPSRQESICVPWHCENLYWCRLCLLSHRYRLTHTSGAQGGFSTKRVLQHMAIAEAALTRVVGVRSGGVHKHYWLRALLTHNPWPHHSRRQLLFG